MLTAVIINHFDCHLFLLLFFFVCSNKVFSLFFSSFLVGQVWLSLSWSTLEYYRVDLCSGSFLSFPNNEGGYQQAKVLLMAIEAIGSAN